jgi:hypothetical protein
MESSTGNCSCALPRRINSTFSRAIHATCLPVIADNDSMTAKGISHERAPHETSSCCTPAHFRNCSWSGGYRLPGLGLHFSYGVSAEYGFGYFNQRDPQAKRLTNQMLNTRGIGQYTIGVPGIWSFQAHCRGDLLSWIGRKQRGRVRAHRRSAERALQYTKAIPDRASLSRRAFGRCRFR